MCINTEKRPTFCRIIDMEDMDKADFPLTNGVPVPCPDASGFEAAEAVPTEEKMAVADLWTK